jgi:hypothetical protein
MKVIMRLVVASFVAAIVVTVAATPANVKASPKQKTSEKAGSASGTFELSGNSIPIRYAVAFTRPAHDHPGGFDFLVLLSAGPAAAKAIAEAKSLDDVRDDGTKGMTGLVALIREGLDPWVELRDPTVVGQSGVTASFVPTATTADRIAGKLSGQTDYNGKPVKFDVTFDAPVIRRLPK